MERENGAEDNPLPPGGSTEENLDFCVLTGEPEHAGDEDQTT